MSKRIKNIVIVIVLGIVLGILSKLGDVIPTGNLIGNIGYRFGLISSGFTVWILICLLISNKSPDKIDAVINVVIFLLSMLVSCYFYSKYIVGYFSPSVAKFWFLMLIPSAIASYLVYDIKHKTKLFKIIIFIVAVLLGLFGIKFFEGTDFYVLIVEIIMLVIIAIIIFKKE